MDFTRALTHSFLQTKFLGNSLRNYLLCLLTILAGWLVAWIAKKWVLRVLRRIAGYTETTFDDVLIENLERLGMPALYSWVAYLALKDLYLKPSLGKFLQVGVTVLMGVQVVRFLLALLREV